MISGFFFSLCVSLKWKSIWYSLNCGKRPQTKSHAVHACDFFVHTGRWKWFCIFSISGGRSEHTFRSFFFLLQVRETEIDFIFSWSWQVTVKKAGVYAVFFTFVSRKIRFYFLVIPKKQINPVCDRIFVACIHCKYTYTAKVIYMSNDIRWLICVLPARWIEFLLGIFKTIHGRKQRFMKMITVRTINGVYCLRTCGFDGKNTKNRTSN